MDQFTARSKTSKIILTIIIYIFIGGTIGAAAYVAFIPGNIRIIIKSTMVGLSLFGWIFSSRRGNLVQYKQLAAAFFSISLGVLISHFIGTLPNQLLGNTLSTFPGIAMAKFGEALPIIGSIILIHFITGGNLDGLFLTGGNWKFVLVSGTIGTGIFLLLAAIQAIGLRLSSSTILSALPWILIFIFSNALMEELWFRALFIKKLEPMIGWMGTLIITSVVFAGIHISSTYVIDIVSFVGVTLVLGLIWAWLIRKANSIWPAVFIHAAGDVLVILGFLA
jgi:membrane protease YdiL (CAAX protease family)